MTFTPAQNDESSLQHAASRRLKAYEKGVYERIYNSAIARGHGYETAHRWASHWAPIRAKEWEKREAGHSLCPALPTSVEAYRRASRGY